MLDLKWIKDNLNEFNNLIEKRGAKVDVDQLINLYEEKKQRTTLIQQFQQAKNEKSKRLGGFKGKRGNDFELVKRDVEHINEKLEELNKDDRDFSELDKILHMIPNLLAPDVPCGTNESMNKHLRSHLEPTHIENAKEHTEIGKALGILDFEQTAKISGSRFVTLKGDLAKMERALINFMIDIHTNEFNFSELSTPVIVRPEAMFNAGQLPKFADDSYEIQGGDFRLIPTGEVTLVNMVADSILKKDSLPKRMVGYNECFRSEAGSAGKDTKGMIRNHQFGKVELVSITTQEESEKEHEYILASSEEILKRLKLPYRVMLLCTGDMGFHAKKTFDIEVWLPGQKKYREISSISNCGDFQARRLKARYRSSEKETSFVHTLNGSGLAVGRTIVAIMENYQNPDGTITVPEALIPYMGGMKIINSAL